MWLKVEGFVDRVKQWWSSSHFQGSPSFTLAHKLKDLKVDLKVWNKHLFDNVENTKKNLLEELSVPDALEEERVLCDEEKIRKYIVIRYLERVTLLEELSWGQKSRALWLREGGSNAQSFSIEWLTRIGEIAPWSLCWSMVQFPLAGSNLVFQECFAD